MSELGRNALKAFFETNDKPTQAEFADLIDSFFNFIDDESGAFDLEQISFDSSQNTLAIVDKNSTARITFTSFGGSTNPINLETAGGNAGFFVSDQGLQAFLASLTIGIDFGNILLQDGFMSSAIDNDAVLVLLGTAQFSTDTARYRIITNPGSLLMFEVHDDKMGLFGVTAVVQPVAIPDTAGATLAQLETEVNKIKAAMRELGSIDT